MSQARVVALVQARMGSSRFPGKMLELLGDYPLLEWVLRRVGRASKLDQVVLATSDQPKDDALVELAENLGFAHFRGSEEDVLGRFVGAAEQYEAEEIVRVCADNPFVDPGEIDRLVTEYQQNPCDYACNHLDRLGSGYADGFGAEILSNQLLQQIAKLSMEPKHREHVTLYLWDHAKQFTLYSIQAPPELAYPDIRFDLDEKKDLENLKEITKEGVMLASPAAEILNISRLLRKNRILKNKSTI